MFPVGWFSFQIPFLHPGLLLLSCCFSLTAHPSLATKFCTRPSQKRKKNGQTCHNNHNHPQISRNEAPPSSRTPPPIPPRTMPEETP